MAEDALTPPFDPPELAGPAGPGGLAAPAASHASPGSPAALDPGAPVPPDAIDPELPVADVRTMTEVVDATLARPRTVSVLLTAFALMALVLAGVGVYGVMA